MKLTLSGILAKSNITKLLSQANMKTWETKLSQHCEWALCGERKYCLFERDRKLRISVQVNFFKLTLTFEIKESSCFPSLVACVSV